VDYQAAAYMAPRQNSVNALPRRTLAESNENHVVNKGGKGANTAAPAPKKMSNRYFKGKMVHLRFFFLALASRIVVFT